MNLKDYIRGQRQGKEANQLERKAMDDAFLQDTIDGYDSVEGDHISVIEKLEKQLSSPQKSINKRMWIWVAAALLLLLTGIPLLLYKPYIQEDITVVSSDIIQQEKESTTPSLQEDTVLVAEHLKSKKEEDRTPRVKQPTSLSVEASPEITELVAGMKSSEIPLKENLEDIVIKADDMVLNEVVVVGYSTQKKRVTTGSVSAVKDISVTDSISVIKDMAAFGEEEFSKYFTENYDKDICAEQNITIIVEFFIDPIGRPAQIDIKENPCPPLENEIKRLLLGSPRWSKTDRKVTLQIELP